MSRKFRVDIPLLGMYVLGTLGVIIFITLGGFYNGVSGSILGGYMGGFFGSVVGYAGGWFIENLTK